MPTTRPWFAIPASIAAWLLGALMAAPLIGLVCLVAIWGFDASTDTVIGRGGAGLVFFLLAVYLPIAIAAAVWLQILLQRTAGGAPPLSTALLATLSAVTGVYILALIKSAVPTGSTAYVVLTLLQWLEIAITPGIVLHIADTRRALERRRPDLEGC